MRVFEWIRREIIEVFPAVIYFFVAFNLINLTFTIEGVRLANLLGVTAGALLIGKILIVIDHFPLLNIFTKKPLIYNTIWKTLIYTAVSCLVRLAEIFIPLIPKYKSVVTACLKLPGAVSWNRFLVVHTWILLLFLIFVTSKETVDAVGREKVRRMFFG